MNDNGLARFVGSPDMTGCCAQGQAVRAARAGAGQGEQRPIEARVPDLADLAAGGAPAAAGRTRPPCARARGAKSARRAAGQGAGSDIFAARGRFASLPTRDRMPGSRGDAREWWCHQGVRGGRVQ